MKSPMYRQLSTAAFISLLCVQGLAAVDGPNGGGPSAGCNNGSTSTPSCDCPDCGCPPAQSIINPYSGLYIHDAVIYRTIDRPLLGGCTTCGAAAPGPSALASNLSTLSLSRFYRSRNGGYLGSLGTNHFISTDYQLRLDWTVTTPPSTTTTLPSSVTTLPSSGGTGNAPGIVGGPVNTPPTTGGTTPGSGGTPTIGPVTVRLFEPGKPAYKRYFSETAGADQAVDGILHDWTGQSLDARMYDVNGRLTPFGSAAQRVVITDNDQTKWTYEVINCGFGATSLGGRLLSITERTGVVRLQLSYVYPASATLAALGNDRARLWEVAQVQAADGTAASYTYDNTRQRGGRYAISQIALPNGSTTSFSYTNNDLTANTLPDGTVATFAVSYDNTLQKVKTVISDPSAEPGHQFKTVWWTGSSYVQADGTTIAQTYGQVRRVDNGAGETVLVTWSDPVVTNYATTQYYWHVDAGLLRFTLTGGATLPTSQAESPDFLLGQDPFLANFTDINTFNTDTGHEFLTGKTDPLGRHRSVVRDPATRNLLSFTDYDGTTSSTTYNAFSFPLVETDRVGRVTTSTYDAQGNRLTKQVGSGSEASTWTWTYDTRGLMTAAIDPRGNETDYGYDANGRLVTITEPADVAGGPRATRSFSYSPASQVLSATDAQGRTIQYSYDARNRVIARSYPDGSAETVTYGAGSLSGLVVATTDRNNVPTTMAYDAAGRVVHTEVASGRPEVQIEDCTYVPGSMTRKLTCVRAGETTAYAYDARGRQTGVTVYPSSAVALTSTQVYDLKKRVVQKFDPYGRQTVFQFDTADRPIRTLRELVPGAFSLDLAAQTLLTSQPQTLTGIALGTPTLAGSTSIAGGTVTLTAAGSDIWGTADQGQFARQSILGDGTLTARLLSQTQPNVWSKAGLMLRSSDAANAAFLDVVVSSYGVTVQKRAFDGASATTSANLVTTLPVWLQIAHAGTDAVARYSSDGVTWVEAGRLTLPLTPFSRIGLVATSHTTTALSTAVFDQVAVAITGTTDPSVLALANEQALAGTTRDLSPNPAYVIEDTVYNAEGQVITRTDGRGISTSLIYDSQARLVSRTEAVGTADSATTSYAYDPNGNQISMTDPRGTVMSQTYTARNLLATNTEASNVPAIAATTSYAYTPTQKVATVTDALGRATTNTYGLCCDRLVAVTDPLGFITKFSYDFVGNRTSVTDANGLTTVTAYDGRNRPVSVTNGAGETTTLTYFDDATSLTGSSGLGLGAGADGSAVVITNPVGEKSTEIRDGLGRTLRRIDGLGHATTMAYDRATNDNGVTLIATTSTDALAHTTTLLIDGAGRTRVTIDALGVRSTASFDANGNRVTRRDGNGVGQDCTYDGRNRETACTDTAGSTTRKIYDANSNLVATSDALGRVETNVYDQLNRKTATTDRVGATTAFAYDLVSNLIQIVDAEGGITDYRYEARNLLDREVFPNGQAGRTARFYGYDAGRRLTSRAVAAVAVTSTLPVSQPAGSEVTSYQYDAANRLTTRAYPDQLNDGFTYDKASRLTQATSARYQNQVRRTYDKASRLTQETLSFVNPLEAADLPISYQYDDANRTTGLTYPDGTKVQRGYTVRNELQQIWDQGTSLASRTYDAGGRLISTLYGNTKVETRSYVPNDNLVASIQIPGVTNFAYQYDALKRKTVERDLQYPDQSQRFNYDDQSRLTTWKQGAGVAPLDPALVTNTWTLSPVGDWSQYLTATGGTTTTQTRTHSKVHELLTINGTALAYDFKGNLTRDDQGQVFAWDYENRLRAATNLKQGQGDSAAYGYDALGRRVKKAVSTVVGATPATTAPTYFVNAGAQEIIAITGDLTAFNDPTADPEDAGAAPFDPATGTGARGSLLTDPSAQRFNFQPPPTDTPDGWQPDTGAVFANANTQGWSSAVSGTDRDHLGRPLYDSFIPLGSATWQVPVANGTHAVVIMCGDADSRAQTNNLTVNGIPVVDPTPYDGQVTHGYETGSFDGYAITVNVTNGLLSISAGANALNPKIDFIEIGAAGSSADPATVARVQAAADKATKDTAKPKPKNPPAVKRNVWGTYVDELLGYSIQKPRHALVRYWVSSNHLFSPSAVTNSAGQVVSRYSYDAYGRQTVRNAAGTVVGMSDPAGLGQGLTGYKYDAESGMYAARARMYSPKLGCFISPDPETYVDGFNSYAAYFIPNNLDPDGNNLTPIPGAPTPPPPPPMPPAPVGEEFDILHQNLERNGPNGSIIPNNPEGLSRGQPQTLEYYRRIAENSIRLYQERLARLEAECPRNETRIQNELGRIARQQSRLNAILEAQRIQQLRQGGGNSLPQIPRPPAFNGPLNAPLMPLIPDFLLGPDPVPYLHPQGTPTA